MNIHVFLVSWDSVYKSVLYTERQLLGAGVKYTVLDSGSTKEQKDNWINIGDVRFYGQLYEALKRTRDEDYIVFMLGDATFDRTDIFVQKVLEYASLYNMGIFAPHYTNSPWGQAQTTLEKIRTSNSLVIASQTDGIVTAFHRDVYTVLYQYMQHLDATVGIQNLRTGWGMDYIWCAIAASLGKFIIRDIAMVAQHPHGSSYDHGKASEEMSLVMGVYSQWSNDSAQAEDIFDKIRRKMGSDPAVTAWSFYGDAKLYTSDTSIPFHIIRISDQRQELVNRALHVLGSDYLKVPVVNGYSEESSKVFLFSYPTVQVKLPKLGEFGCFASHYNFWQHVLKNKLDNAVVLEDDAFVHDEFIFMYKYAIMRIPNTYDVFSMYVDKDQHSRYNVDQRLTDEIATGYQDWSTLCYFISVNGAKKLIELVEQYGMDQPVDWFIFRHGHAGRLNVYTWNPRINPPVSINKDVKPQIIR